MRRGCYPGSFSPPTTAHLAVADAARRARALDQVVWVVSTVALAKEDVVVPALEDRLDVLEAVAADHDWLSIECTDAQLLVDLARGYDVVIMGADKWHQIHDPTFYGGQAARDAAVAALPDPLVVPRDGLDVPARLRLDVDPAVEGVSSTAARAGRHELMLPAAVDLDRRTGAWTDPARYLTWRTTASARKDQGPPPG